MTKSTTYIIVGAVVLAAVAGAVWFQKQNPQQGGKESGQQKEQGQNQEENGGLVVTSVVLYTDSGFAPQVFTIKQGEEVTFVNQSSNPMWAASAIHPTHKVYPGSDIAKCATGEASAIFDSCKGVASGEEWSFTFSEKGNWGYHDHLSPNMRGTIIVE
ncbi:MAG: hypothetical protein HYW97_02525 [Candidatus Wildermuthbacteria bacterium]|nr:hypothetical protein [Candidatus Wildermuthbacteria bacterium]